MALVTVDGGGGYWNPHAGDDPQGMLVRELIPRCQRQGLGTGCHTSAFFAAQEPPSLAFLSRHLTAAGQPAQK